MKQISKFIIKKVTWRENDVIELFVEIDDLPQYFSVRIEATGESFLAEFSKDLEFLLRANDVGLSKNLMRFLGRVLNDKKLNFPVNLFPKLTTQRKLRPRQPQAA